MTNDPRVPDAFSLYAYLEGYAREQGMMASDGRQIPFPASIISAGLMKQGFSAEEVSGAVGMLIREGYLVSDADLINDILVCFLAAGFCALGGNSPTNLYLTEKGIEEYNERLRQKDETQT